MLLMPMRRGRVAEGEGCRLVGGPEGWTRRGRLVSEASPSDPAAAAAAALQRGKLEMEQLYREV